MAKKKYYQGVGRRKTAVAIVRLFPEQEPEFLINEKNLEQYFPTGKMKDTAKSALKKVSRVSAFKVSVLARGGGLNAQAEAIRHGSARALLEFNPDFKEKLTQDNLLTRDPRMKERKKYGLKGARRAPQWQKR